MIPAKVPLFILILAITATLFLRIMAITAKKTIGHDEGISYLSSTGHQGVYHDVITKRLHPFGAWSPASEWKSFIRPAKAFCFKTIGSDLAHYDIHPPLYFWLLHLWILMVGTHLWAGPLLNLFLALLTFFLLLRLAQNTLGSSVEAAMVVLIWALSPSVIKISLVARQYDLLALCTVLFVWQVINCIDQKSECQIRQLAALTISTAIGALTHYYFSLTVVGCSVLMILVLVKKDVLRLMKLHLSVGVGYIVFFLCHHQFYLSFERRQGGIQLLQPEEMITRFDTFLVNLSAFFVPGHILKYILFIVLLGGVIALLWSFFRRPASRSGSVQLEELKVYWIVFFFLWITGITCFLYLAGITPEHAMASTHLGMIWPFLAFIPVLVIRVFAKKTKHLLMLCVCAWQVFFGGAYVLAKIVPQATRMSEPIAPLEGSHRIILDNAARGALPRIIWHVPDNAKTFVGSRDYLLIHQERWLEEACLSSIYVSIDLYQKPGEQKNLIVQSIREKCGDTHLLFNSQVGDDYIPLYDGIWKIEAQSSHLQNGNIFGSCLGLDLKASGPVERGRLPEPFIRGGPQTGLTG